MRIITGRMSAMSPASVIAAVAMGICRGWHKMMPQRRARAGRDHFGPRCLLSHVRARRLLLASFALGLLLSGIALLPLQPALAAEGWEPIYDSSSDNFASWQTNDPTNFYYWGLQRAYHYKLTSVGTPGSAYQSLPPAYTGSSFRLEFDWMPLSTGSLYSDHRIMFADAVTANHPEGVIAHFTWDAFGRDMFLEVNPSDGSVSGTWTHGDYYSDGQWYHAVIEFDDYTRSVRLLVTTVPGGAVILDNTVYGAIAFAHAHFLALSAPSGLPVAPEPAEGWIKHVVFSKPTGRWQTLYDSSAPPIEFSDWARNGNFNWDPNAPGPPGGTTGGFRCGVDGGDSAFVPADFHGDAPFTLEFDFQSARTVNGIPFRLGAMDANMASDLIMPAPESLYFSLSSLSGGVGTGDFGINGFWSGGSAVMPVPPDTITYTDGPTWYHAALSYTPDERRVVGDLVQLSGPQAGQTSGGVIANIGPFTNFDRIAISALGLPHEGGIPDNVLIARVSGMIYNWWPQITSLTAAINNAAFTSGTDVGYFISPLPQCEVDNTFTAAARPGGHPIDHMTFTLKDPGGNVITTSTANTAPYQFTYNMSALPTGDSTLEAKAWDTVGWASSAERMTIHTIAPPSWVGQSYVADFDTGTHPGEATVGFDSAAGAYTFKCRVPYIDSISRTLYVENYWDVPLLGTLHNLFESDIQVTEKFDISGNWTYDAQGVLQATALSFDLLSEVLPFTADQNAPNPPYRNLAGYSATRTWTLAKGKVNIYDGILWEAPPWADVRLSLDFGYDATLTITGSLNADLSANYITMEPIVTPEMKADLTLDILMGVAGADVKGDLTLALGLPVSYSWAGYTPPAPNPVIPPGLSWDPWAHLTLIARAQVWALLWTLYDSGWRTVVDESWGNVPAGHAPVLSDALSTAGAANDNKPPTAPAIAYSPSGDGMCVWVRDTDTTGTGARPALYYATPGPGGAWSAPQPVTSNDRWLMDPQVAFTGAHTAVAVWTQNDNDITVAQPEISLPEALSGQDIWYAVWGGTQWGSPGKIIDDGSYNPGPPLRPSDGRAAVAGDPATGRAFAVWVRDLDADPATKTDWQIWYSVYQNGSWSAPAAVTTNAAAHCEPTVAFDSSGYAWVAWVEDSDGDFKTNADRVVRVKPWSASGWFPTMTLVSSDPSAQATGALYPSAQPDPNGRVMIAFCSRGNDPSGNPTGEGYHDILWLARWVTGSGWQVLPVRAGGTEQVRARWPKLLVMPDGAPTVVCQTDTLRGSKGFLGKAGIIQSTSPSAAEWTSLGLTSSDDTPYSLIAGAVDGQGRPQIVKVVNPFGLPPGSPGPAAMAATAAAVYDDVVIETPNLPPTVMITETPTVAHVGETVQFDSHASDPDGGVVGCVWEFGDGVGDNGMSAQHVYTRTGQYTVHCTATDPLGAIGMATFTIDVLPAVPPHNFADVLPDHWAWPFIEAIYREGITTGCDVNPLRYCPDGVVTRGEMAAFICRAAGQAQLTPPTATFADVPTDHQFFGWIERLADPGSWATPPTSGCDVAPLRYCPSSNCLRQQMAAFICRASGKTWYDPGTATFPDVPRGADGVFTQPIVANGCDADGTHQFYGWIERLADPASWGAYGAPTRGFDDGTFRPDNNCTRGEMAVFLCRAFEISY